MKRNWLAVGIILFMFGSTVMTPRIDANSTMKPSDDDLVAVVQTDKTIYQMGEPVEIWIYAVNHGDMDITLVFPTALIADYVISDVYHWAEGGYFPDIVCNVTIPSGGQKLLLHDTWDQVSCSGNQVFPGTYQIYGWIVPSMYYVPVYSEPVYITIGSEVNIEVHEGIGLTVSITNTGLFDATDINGRISIKGGILNHIKLSEPYFVNTLKVNESILKTVYPFGIGPVEITITVSAFDAKPASFEGKTSVVLFFVYPITKP